MALHCIENVDCSHDISSSLTLTFLTWSLLTTFASVAVPCDQLKIQRQRSPETTGIISERKYWHVCFELHLKTHRYYK